MLKTHLQYRTVGEVGHHPLFGRASFAAMSTNVLKPKWMETVLNQRIHSTQIRPGAWHKRVPAKHSGRDEAVHHRRPKVPDIWNATKKTCFNINNM